METLYTRTDTRELKGKEYKQVEIVEVFSREGVTQQQIDFYTHNNYILIQRDLESFKVIKGVE